MKLIITESHLEGIVKENLSNKGPKINLISTNTLTPKDERMIDKIKKVYLILRKGMVHLQFNNKPLINVMYELPPLNETSITVSKFSRNGDVEPTKYFFKLQDGKGNLKFEVLNPEDFGYNNMIKNADNIISMYWNMMYANIKSKFKNFNIDLQ
jgi:hypothetical protein